MAFQLAVNDEHVIAFAEIAVGGAPFGEVVIMMELLGESHDPKLEVAPITLL